MTRPIGLAPQTLVDLSPLALTVCAAEAGYDVVGLRLQPAMSSDRAWPVIGRTPMVREIRLRLDDSGMRALDVELLRLTPQTVVADFEPLVETAAYLGATQLLVVANDADRERLAANLWSLAELTEPFGLTPNIEFMPWTDVPTVVDAAALLRKTNHPNAAIIVDPLHLHRSGGSASDVVDMPSGYFRYIQLCDAPARLPGTLAEQQEQARSDRRYPGDGELDVSELLRNLPHSIPATLEAPIAGLADVAPTEQARLGLAAVRRFLSHHDLA